MNNEPENKLDVTFHHDDSQKFLENVNILLHLMKHLAMLTWTLVRLRHLPVPHHCYQEHATAMFSAAQGQSKTNINLCQPGVLYYGARRFVFRCLLRLLSV